MHSTLMPAAGFRLNIWPDAWSGSSVTQSSHHSITRSFQNTSLLSPLLYKDRVQHRALLQLALWAQQKDKSNLWQTQTVSTPVGHNNTVDCTQTFMCFEMFSEIIFFFFPTVAIDPRRRAGILAFTTSFGPQRRRGRAEDVLFDIDTIETWCHPGT